MFVIHQPIIGDWARRSPRHFERVLQFVCATIKQPLESTPAIVASYMVEGDESDHAWGWKADALFYYEQNRDEIYRVAMDTYNGYGDDHVKESELLLYFADMIGLGPVKAGFVIQLAFGLGGCMDRHNLARFDISPRKFAASTFKSLKPASKAKRIAEYQHALANGGGCEALWDGWCQYVADLRPDVFEDAYEVSEMHITALHMGDID